MLLLLAAPVRAVLLVLPEPPVRAVLLVLPARRAVLLPVPGRLRRQALRLLPRS